MLGNNEKDKKVSFLKSFPQLSLFKPNEKTSSGKKEKHFSFTKRSEKDQLKADWQNTCVEMNKRARNLQVKERSIPANCSLNIIQDALTEAEEKKIKIKPRNVFKAEDDSELSSKSQDNLHEIKKDSLTFDRNQRKSTKKKHLFRLNTMDTM